MVEVLEVTRKILVVLFWFCEVNVLYYALLYFVGLFAHKQKYPMAEDKQKFCILVPCHNEGPVVEATVENYTHIEYSKDLFDIYFIADNCADNTAEVLENAIKKYNATNFHVLVRSDSPSDQRGKPYAIKWANDTLEAQGRFYSYYDMMMIFDADNFVDAGILKHVNSQYLSIKDKKKPVMIQCYLDSKNKQGLVARGYFETYRVMNAFWQMSKQKLNLVPGIGGTGFAMDIKFLESIGGFTCKPLTEDLEIETIATIRNKRIAYNGNVRVYDEKPTKVRAAFVQRTRWARGHWYLFFKYVPILFIQLFNPKTIKNFFKKIDMMVYLSSRLFGLVSSIAIILNLFYMIGAWSYGMEVTYTAFWVQILSFVLLGLSIVIIPVASLYDGNKEEKKRILIDFIPNVIAMYFIAIVDMIIGYPGLFKCGNQKVWKKTTHSITTMDKNMVNQKAK